MDEKVKSNTLFDEKDLGKLSFCDLSYIIGYELTESLNQATKKGSLKHLNKMENMFKELTTRYQKSSKLIKECKRNIRKTEVKEKNTVINDIAYKIRMLFYPKPYHK